MKKVILGFLVCISFSISAQYYSPIQVGGYLMYTDGTSSYGLQTDSIKVYGVDSIYYFNNNIEASSATSICYKLSGPSWLGRKAIYKGGGVYIYLNQYNDTIRLKTANPVDSNWTCFIRRTDTLTVKAKIIKKDTLTYLSLNDTVAVIIFSVFDKNGNPQTHVLNGKTIRLSRRFGFIEAINLNEFPNALVNGASQFLPISSTLTLTGISWLGKGVSNLKWSDVNDLEVADELHVRGGSNWGAGGYPWGVDSTLSLIKINGKEVKTDTTIYYMSNTTRHYAITYLTGGGFTTSSNLSYRKDTMIVIPDKEFDALPYQSSGLGKYVQSLIGLLNIQRKVRSGSFGLSKQNDSCYNIVLYGGCAPDYEYWEGLGGPYYYCNYNNVSYQYRKLRFYKKGNLTWGNPIPSVILSSMDERFESELILSPNPATNYLIINTQNDEQLEITDFIGRKKAEIYVIGNMHILDVSNYPQGLYVCRSKTRSIKFIVNN